MRQCGPEGKGGDGAQLVLRRGDPPPRAKDAKKIDTIDRIVVFDVLGTEQLIRKPRNLYDAWVLSMIVPLVSISANELELFELKYDRKRPGDEGKLLHRIRFADEIPVDHWPNVLDWSYSNLQELFDAGQRAAERFILSKDWLSRRARELPDAGELPAAAE